MDGARQAAAGDFSKRLAEAWLRDLLDEARRGTLPGLVRTGARFEDAAAEYLRYIEHDRGRKPSTVRGYRSGITAHLLPAFGSLPVELVTSEVIEQWVAGFDGSVRTRKKLLIQLHGILGRAKRVYGLRVNAAAEVEKFPQRRSGDIEVFSPEEVWALVRAAALSRPAGNPQLRRGGAAGVRMGRGSAAHERTDGRTSANAGAGTAGEHTDAGGLRDRQVFIGPTEAPITDARFVPAPHGDQLKAAFEAWIAWVNRQDVPLPPVVRVALAHYQFKTLHPYSDGNGRIGRLAIVLQLIRLGVLRDPILVSPWF